MYRVKQQLFKVLYIGKRVNRNHSVIENVIKILEDRINNSSNNKCWTLFITKHACQIGSNFNHYKMSKVDEVKHIEQKNRNAKHSNIITEFENLKVKGNTPHF